jgi:hypothetical protein
VERIRLSKRLVALALAVAGLAPDAGPAAARAQEEVRTIRAERLADAAVTVDGRLDEPVWSRLEASAGFLQRDPDEGQAVSERTEVMVFYDDARLYFGFRCYDSAPDRVIARYATHDARTNSDSVDIFLDPFGDRRTGYHFSISARGVQYDALVTEANGNDSTWDGIWQAATHFTEWGWTAEVAIPFKSIRFASGRPWGVNFGREIVRKNERAFWQFVTRFDGRMRPSKAGILEGIEGVEPGRNLEVVPYISSRIRRGAPDSRDDSTGYEGGADIRWGPLPNLTANLSLNPDFAETEADEFNITISRFELFFPEKRAFFNEGSNFFATPLNLFFTRRVGARLPDGRPQRILLGAKLTGKVGDWSLGLLEARTEQTRFTDPETRDVRTAPAANFLVARVQRDIWSNSTIGFLTANRDQTEGDIGSTQRVHAVDLGVVRGPHIRWQTQAAYNQNSSGGAGGIHRAAFLSSLNRNSDELTVDVRYKFLGRGVDLSALGFEPERDRHDGSLRLEYRPFLDRAGFRQIFFETYHQQKLNTAGLSEESEHSVSVGIRFQNYWFWRVRYAEDRVRFFSFTPEFGRTPETRLYAMPRVFFSLNTDPNRATYFRYEYSRQRVAQFRENFYGRSETHRVELTWRMFDRTRVENYGLLVREFLLDRTPFQVRRLFISRVNHQFTRRLRARVLAQAANDRHGHLYSVNSIVAYDFTARSAAIAGYNYQRSSPGRPRDLGNEFFFKLSYVFHF